MTQSVKKTPRRTIWFISILFVLVLGAAVTAAVMALNNAERTVALNVEQRLSSQLRDGLTALRVWHQGLAAYTERMAQSDLFRLFASEVSNLNGAPLTPELEERLPTMRKLLQDYLGFTGFSSARLMGKDAVPFLAVEAEGELSNQQRRIQQEALATGKPAVGSAVPTQDGRLLVDVAQPIFAPDYAEEAAGKPVAVLLVVVDASGRARDQAAFSDKSGSENQFIAQIQDGMLEGLDPRGLINRMEGWHIEDNELPLGVRTLPTGSKVYSLGMSVAELPWWLVQTIDKDTADAPYAAHRKVILIMTAAGTIISLLLIGVFWWWFVGMRERAVSRELTSLNDTVNRQNQLLASIDNTMPGGVALSDANHILLHVNTSFGTMLSHSPKALLGISLLTLFRGEMADRLRDVLPKVVQSGGSQTFTSTMLHEEKKIHCHVVCTPFNDADKNITGVVSVFQDITDEVEAQERQQRRVDQTMAVLVRAIEAVDPYLCGQSANTRALSGKLVEAMHLSPSDAATVLTSAHLYQIGLIQVPRDILNKEQKLTPEERAELERHVSYAREALSSMDFDHTVLDTISQMYERMDGSGYPDRLTGDKICIHARILAVANTFCALVRPRSYRNAKTMSDALAILSADAYDTEVVKTLRTFLDSQAGRSFVAELTSPTKTDGKE